MKIDLFEIIFCQKHYYQKDRNSNNRYDGPEKAGECKFNYNAIIFSEPFSDALNGRYDQGEKYEDLNDDGKWYVANANIKPNDWIDIDITYDNLSYYKTYHFLIESLNKIGS